MSLFKELKRRNVFRVGIAYSVATWLLLQVADIVFPRIGLPDSAVTLVIALLAIGFIPALIFGWAFESTPEVIKREKDVDRSESMTPATAKSLDRLIIAGLLLVIVGMGVERIWFAEHNEPREGSGSISPEVVQESKSPATGQLNLTPASGQAQRESVAVLPFTAMSSGEDDGYFADGLTEELLNSLARLPELLVTARISSFHFKDKSLPAPEIAKALGVEHVVEGSVRRSGNRVRITAQLIRAEDGFHLWSQTYDRTLEDTFAVQEDSPLGDENILIAQAALGDRETANATAARMDARFAGPFILAEAVKGCFCGAPFDLEATPNFKVRIEEAGFPWPPVTPTKHPAKDC